MTRRGVISFGIVGILLIAGAFWAFSRSAAAPTALRLPTSASMSLKGVSLQIAIADTESSRERGLGGYDGLAPDEGMLFVFGSDGRYSFWMKDMRFAIDMVWLDAAGRVVSIAKSVAPETYPQAFTPDSPARYVLEVPAGFCDMHDIRVGDAAILP